MFRRRKLNNIHNDDVTLCCGSIMFKSIRTFVCNFLIHVKNVLLHLTS